MANCQHKPNSRSKASCPPMMLAAKLKAKVRAKMKGKGKGKSREWEGNKDMGLLKTQVHFLHFSFSPFFYHSSCC